MDYKYKAFVEKVYDGDTITVSIDCGFGIQLQKQKIRLYGINTPEVRGEERELGLISRDKLREKILGKTIVLNTIKDKKGKYGRYLGIIYLNDENINDWLVANNLAVEVDY
tara:strand:- start:2047 stop:2379 length:333 start_codon:yes stop_codon:yes gene_type:complete